MNKIIEKVVEPSKITVGSTFLLKIKVDDSIETREAQGTNIYINDCVDSSIVRLKLLGNSIQDGTPTTSSPVDIKNAGGIINYFDKETILAKHLINSNGTITEDNYNFVSDFIEVDGNIKYTISAATNKAKRIAYYNSEQTFISRPVISNYSGTVTTPSNAKYVRLSCHNDDLDSLQLEKGSFVSSYVPYYNRMAKITETISNKNLFDGELELGNYDNDGNKISVSNIYRCANFIKVNSNTTYTISLNGVSKRYVVYYYDNSKTFISMTTALTTGTFTTPNNTQYVTFRCFGADFTNDFSNLKIQIEKGSTATFYIAHQEQLFTIPCQQPMRSIGEVRDEFIKQDGVWYERHVFALMTLNGTDELSWSKRGSGSSSFFSNSVLRSSIKKPLSNDVKANILSDTFENKTNTEIREQTNGISIRTNGDIELYFNEISNYSVATFESWLATHNINLIYELNEPIDLECTQEQFQALESIAQSRTYEPITNIYSTDETPAYLDLIYYKKEE